MIMTFEISTE